jgi:hypothetical protein
MKTELLQDWLNKLAKTRYQSLTGTSAKTNCDVLLSMACDKYNIGRGLSGSIVFAEIYPTNGVMERIEAKDYKTLLKRLIMHVYATNNAIIIALHMLVWARANRW